MKWFRRISSTDGNTVSETEEISLTDIGTTISLSQIEGSKCLNTSCVSKLVYMLCL